MTTKRTPKPKRYEYHVTYDATSNQWLCKVGGALFCLGYDRETVIHACASWLDSFSHGTGQHSELIIHRKDGTIGRGSSSRRTYGGDPKGTKG